MSGWAFLKWQLRDPLTGFPTAHTSGRPLLASAVALAFGVYAHWKFKDPKPPKQRLPYEQWTDVAGAYGFAVAVGVAYLTFWIVRVLWGLGRAIINELLPLSNWVWTFTEWLALVPILVMAGWALVACRDLYLEVMRTAAPRELRLAVDLRERAEAFRDRARVLQQAMEEATAISEQLHRGIDAERQQLSQVHEDYLRKSRLSELTPEQTAAVVDLLDRQQTRSGRKALWSNVAVGFIFYAAGVLTPAVVSTETLRDQVRGWLPIG